MRRKTILLLALALAATVAKAQKLIPQDPDVRKGKLKNGMTYYVRRNTQTPGVADFYIAQRVGSILEEPRQRGLAHFLEHMAFNGTLNFPGAEGSGGLREWCEQKGIKFGANLNAYTSVDQTVYNISAAPVSKPGVADTCLLILHDWSHYLLLEDEEIDKERGVIHEEWRTRRTGRAVQRLMEEAMPTMYRGTKYEDCLPIGSMDVVDNFSYDALRDYYQKWYRPDLQAIIVVGDIDVDQMEKKIRKLYSPIPLPKQREQRVYYPVDDNDRMIVFAVQDKEQPTCNFALYMKRDITPFENRQQEDYYRDGYISDLITMMLRDRLSELGEQAEPPFLTSSCRDGVFFVSQTKDAFSLTCGLRQDRPGESIMAAVGEAERARQHGFTATELERAKAELKRRAEGRHRQRTKMPNRHFVNRCVNNFLTGEPLMSTAEELRLVEQLNGEVTLEQVNQTTREIISDRNQVVTLYAPLQDGFTLPTNEELEQYVLTAQQQQYEPYKDKVTSQQLLPALPTAGTVLLERDAESGYHEFVLSNGMHVFARQTDFAPDNIQINIFSAGGQSIYPDSDYASMAYLNRVISASGIGQFSQSDLQKALTGKSIRLTPSVSREGESISGVCAIKDFETMLQLAHLYFTSPRRDEQAFKSLMSKQAAFLTNREASPNVQMNDSVVDIVYGGHPRMRPLKKELLDEVSLDRILQIYAERFADASDFDVVLTGNVSIDSLRPLLCQYLASLPSTYSRERTIDRGLNIRPVSEVHVFRKAMATPSAQTNIYVSAPVAYNAKNDLLLDVLSQLMRIQYTEKVREEKGGTYGVSVQGSLSDFPQGEALMTITFSTDPAKYDELIPIIYEQLQLMSEQGPTAENLEKVKQYEHKAYGQNIVTNGYWEYVMRHKLQHGVNFDSDYLQMVDELTTDDIRQFCATLLSPKRCIQVTMLPEEK